jgi:hypothetical protein
VRHLLVWVPLVVIEAAGVALLAWATRTRPLPPGDESSPVVYPGDELQQERDEEMSAKGCESRTEHGHG